MMSENEIKDILKSFNSLEEPDGETIGWINALNCVLQNNQIRQRYEKS